MNTSIDEIVDKLKYYNAQYRIGQPIVSDAEYDKLKDKLRALDPGNSWLNAIEPSFVSVGRKRQLPIQMKSLDKVKSISEIHKWLKSLDIPQNTPIVVTPKFDGISWLHDEESGSTFSRGGTENEGQDCTAHYLKGNFGNVGQWSVFFAPRYTFGELVFRTSDWTRHFEGEVSDTTGESYKSPRNTIAGLINRDEASELIKHSTFFRYGVGDLDLKLFDTYTSLYDELCLVYGQSNLKFTVSAEEISEEILAGLYAEWRKEFYIDGLVIYLDDLSLWEAVGRQQTSGNPLYAMAYKHPDFTESFETKVNSIEWNVSKSGALKPVVQIDAVNTGDCIMESPTGYNAGWIRDHLIGIGSKILVTRSGGVIPKILETLIPVKVQLPDSCPACGGSTEFDEKGIELYCTNSNCRGKQLAKIIHFMQVVGTENIGEEIISKIYNAGHVTIKSFLNLKWDDLISIEGFGESIANNILSQMKKIKEGVDLATLMHSSDCFKGIGRIKAQKILDTMDDEVLCSFCQGWYVRDVDVNPDTDHFQQFPVTIQNLLLGYFPFMQFLDETKIPYIIPRRKEVRGDKCSTLSVCFTGVRDPNLEAYIYAEGGRVVSGVSKNTSHLIVKDEGVSSSKVSKAHHIGVPVITIEDFKKMVKF